MVRVDNESKYIYWRKSRQKEEKLRERRKIEALTQRINTLATIGRIQGKWLPQP